MFNKRCDGTLVKDIAPFSKIVPYIMYERTDATNTTMVKIDCAPLDEYIKKKSAEGIEYDYMDLVLAGMVRVIGTYPKLNRFVVNGKVFQRNCISVSVAVHRNLRGIEEETTVKANFTGKENLAEIKQIFDDTVRKNVFNNDENSTDNMAKVLTRVPHFLVRLCVNFLMRLDKWNMLPKSVVELSPFHTTFWITNLKSLGIDTIHHHIYNFGTSSHFLALGKEKYNATVVNKDTVTIKKELEMGYVMDERICDGLYFARATKLMKKLMRSPELLEENLK